MAHIEMGNGSVVESRRVADNADLLEVVERPDLGEQVTTLRTPPDISLAEAFATITGVWAHHSNQPPLWVEASDIPLRDMLRAHYGVGGKP